MLTLRDAERKRFLGGTVLTFSVSPKPTFLTPHSCHDPGWKLFPSEPQTPPGRKETPVTSSSSLHREGLLSDPGGSGMLACSGDTQEL